MIAGVAKLGIDCNKDNLKIFMEDGSMVCEDDDVKDEEVIGGKLLILAEDFSDYREKGELFEL